MVCNTDGTRSFPHGGNVLSATDSNTQFSLAYASSLVTVALAVSGVLLAVLAALFPKTAQMIYRIITEVILPSCAFFFRYIIYIFTAIFIIESIRRSFSQPRR